jgi:Hypervirulence associated proteins TUDOR domain
MSQDFKKGDHVKWNSSQGEVEGTVERKLTEPTEIKSHHVAASKENPEYLVKSDKSGKEAAHKPDSLEKAE